MNTKIFPLTLLILISILVIPFSGCERVKQTVTPPDGPSTVKIGVIQPSGVAVSFSIGHEISKNGHEISKNGHEISKNGHKISKNGHEISKNGHEISKNGHKTIHWETAQGK